MNILDLVIIYPYNLYIQRKKIKQMPRLQDQTSIDLYIKEYIPPFIKVKSKTNITDYYHQPIVTSKL